MNNQPANLLYFTDRKIIINRFERIITMHPPDWFMTISGFSGTGKSTLIEWLIHNKCREIPFVYFEASTAQDEIAFLHDFASRIEIHVNESAFKDFLKMYDESKEWLKKSNISNTIEIDTKDSSSVSDTHIHVQREVLTSAQEHEQEKVLEAFILKLESAFEEMLRSYHPNLLVCFIDTFEKLTNKKKIDWLLKILYRLHCRLPGFRLILAGQEKVEVRSHFHGQNHEEITELEEKDAMDYLVNKRSLPEALAKRVYSITKGHPFLMNVYADEIKEEGIENFGPDPLEGGQFRARQDIRTIWIYKRIIERLAEQGVPQKVIEYTSSFPRFNREILRYVFPDGNTDLAFQALIGMTSFIRPSMRTDEEGYYCFHDLLPKNMATYLQGCDKTIFQEVHQRAYQYNLELLRSPSTDSEDRFNPIQARNAQVALTHAIWWNTNEAWNFMVREAASAFALWRRSYIESLVVTVEDHPHSSRKLKDFAASLKAAVSEVASRNLARNLIAILELFISSCELEPDIEGMIRRSVATLYKRKGKDSKALLHLEAAVALPSDKVKNLLAKADFHLEKKDFQNCIACCQSAIEAEPENTAALSMLGRVYSVSGQKDLANEVYQRIFRYSLECEQAQDVIKGAEGLLQADRKADAYTLLKRAASLLGGEKEESASGWHIIGNAYMKAQDWTEAENALRRSISVDGTVPEVWFSLGECLSGKKQWQEAVEAYSRVSEIDPYLSALAIESIGNTYIEQEKWDEAEQAFRKALDLDSGRFRSWFSLGGIYREQKRWNEAASAYEQAIGIEPLSVFAYFEISDIYREQQQWDKAVLYLEQVGSFSEEAAPMALEKISDIYNLQGLFDRAAQAAQHSLSLDSSRARAWVSAGYAYKGQGKWEEAELALQKAFELDTKFGPLTFSIIGDIHLDQKSWPKAEEAFRNSLKLDDKRLDSWLGLSSSLFHQDQLDAANEVLKIAHSISPNAIVLSATGLMEKNEMKEATHRFSKYLELQKANNLEIPAAAWKQLAIFYEKQFNWPEAIAANKKVAELEPEIAYVSWERIGKSCLELGDLVEAEQAFRHVVGQHEERTIAWFYLARILQEQGRQEEAVAIFERIIHMPPESLSADSLEILGNVFIAQKKWAEAEQALRRSLSLDETRAGPWYCLGEVFHATGHLAEATGYLWKAIELDHNFEMRAGLIIGQILFDQKRYIEAESLYKQLLKSDAGKTIVWVMLSQIYENLERWDDAIAVHQKIAELSPEMACVAMEKTGKLILIQKRRPQEAEHWLRKAIEIDSNMAEAWLLLGIALEEQKRYREAIDVLHSYEIIEIDADMGSIASERIGRACIALMDWSAAETAFRRALSLNESNFLAHLGLGKTLMEQGRWEEALSIYEKAEGINHEEVKTVYSYIAYKLDELGRKEEASAWLEKMKVEQEVTADSLLFEATTLKNAHRPEEAEDVFLKLLELFPNDASYREAAYFSLGEIYQQQNRFSEAIGAFNKVASEGTNLRAASFNALCLIYASLKNWKEAERCARLALEIDPSVVFSWIILANSLEEQQRADEAIEAHRNVSALDPSLAPTALKKIGDLYLYLENWAAAEDAFRQAVTMEPGLGIVWFNLGRLLLAQERWDEAISSFEAAIKADSGWESDALMGIGGAYLHLENWTEAESVFRYLLSLVNPNQNAWVGLVQALEGQERCSEAIEIHKKIGALAPEVLPTVQKKIGDLYLRMENYVAAEEALRQSLALNASQYSSWYSLGYALSGQGRWDEAIRSFENAFKINPELEAGIMAEIGKIYMKQERWVDAELAFRRSVELNSTLVDAFIGLGKSLEEQARWDEAATVHNQVASMIPENPYQVYGYIGNFMKKAGREQDAEQWFNRVIDPDTIKSPADALLRAQVLFEFDQLQDVEALARRAIETAPPEGAEIKGGAYLILGQIRINQGDLQEAEEFCKLASRQQPMNTDPLMLLAGIYEKQRLWDKALAMHQKIMELNPSLAGTVLFKIGYNYMIMQEWKAAEVSFREALKINEKDTNSWFWLARSMERQKRWEEAIQAHEQVSQMEPTLYEDANIYLTRILRDQLSEYDRAFDKLKVLRSGPKYSIKAEIEFAVTLLLNGQREEAKNLAIEILQKLNSQPELQTDENYDETGYLFMRWLDQPETAFSLFETGLEHNPDYINLLINLTRCLEIPSCENTVRGEQVRAHLRELIQDKEDSDSIRRMALLEFKEQNFDISSSLCAQSYAVASEQEQELIEVIQSCLFIVRGELPAAVETLDDLLANRLLERRVRWEIWHDLNTLVRSSSDPKVSKNIEDFLELYPQMAEKA